MLANSINNQLHFTSDPGSEVMYTQMYLQFTVIMHLVENWEILGSEISENIKMSYGCPDSEVSGLKITVMKGKGRNWREEYGFSIKDWSQYILGSRSWCEWCLNQMKCRQ